MAVGHLNPLGQLRADHERTQLQRRRSRKPGCIQSNQVFRNVGQQHANPPAAPGAKPCERAGQAPRLLQQARVGHALAVQAACRTERKALLRGFQQGRQRELRIMQRRRYIRGVRIEPGALPQRDHPLCGTRTNASKHHGRPPLRIPCQGVRSRDAWQHRSGRIPQPHCTFGRDGYKARRSEAEQKKCQII